MSSHIWPNYIRLCCRLSNTDVFLPNNWEMTIMVIVRLYLMWVYMYRLKKLLGQTCLLQHLGMLQCLWGKIVIGCITITFIYDCGGWWWDFISLNIFHRISLRFKNYLYPSSFFLNFNFHPNLLFSCSLAIITTTFHLVTKVSAYLWPVFSIL